MYMHASADTSGRDTPKPRRNRTRHPPWPCRSWTRPDAESRSRPFSACTWLCHIARKSAGAGCSGRNSRKPVTFASLQFTYPQTGPIYENDLFQHIAPTKPATTNIIYYLPLTLVAFHDGIARVVGERRFLVANLFLAQLLLFRLLALACLFLWHDGWWDCGYTKWGAPLN